MARTQKRSKVSKATIEELRGQLLDWYDEHRRVLPWRSPPGEQPDPYHVWLSEIMLQQTTVGAVGPYFTKFIHKWPAIKDLAAADRQDVMDAWAGLGYYARARNLHACAQTVTEALGGVFPQDEPGLKALPGIGDYTAAAVRTIAFNKPAAVMDGNIERVLSRFFAVKTPLPKAKPVLKALAGEVFAGFDTRPGDLAQAMMDLGATVCIAGQPRCGSCPLSSGCQARAQDLAAALPYKDKKKPRPQKHGSVYWIENEEGAALLHRRADDVMLGGMTGLPGTDWVGKKEKPSVPAFLKHTSPEDYGGQRLTVSHSFTHFDLELSLKAMQVRGRDICADAAYFWCPRAEIKQDAFPTLFAKALKFYLSG